MKKILLYIVLGLCIATTGCSLLEEPTYTQFSENDFYQTEAHAKSAMSGVYKSVKDVSTRVQFFGNVGTDEARMYAGSTEFITLDTYIIGSDTEFIKNFWDELYKGINKANDVINGVEGSPLSDEVKKVYIAEARFLRGFFYYYVVRVWGDAPLKLKPSVDLESSIVGLSPAKDIYDAIIEDFTYAAENLPVSQTLVGRATKGAALAYKASTHLTMTGYPLYDNTQYQAAFDAAEDVVELGVYDLVEDYEDLYIIENNKESIFEFQAGTIKGTGGSIKTFMGVVSTFPVVQHQEDPAKHVPDLRAGKDNIRPCWKFVDTYSPNDYRRKVSIAEYVLEGVDKNGTVTKVVSDITEVVKTYFDVDGDRTSTGISKYRFANGTDVRSFTETDNPLNFTFMRYAEIYLILAEAAYYKDGANDAQKAIEYLRPLTDRANFENTGDLVAVWDGTGDFAERILKERSWELCFEGKRWYDLKRLGKLVDYVSKRDLAADGSAYSISYKEFKKAEITESLIDMPIPQIEIDANDKIN